MKRYLLIAFYLIQFCSLSVAQVMSINGVPMTDAGGAPSNCTAGSYKRISSAVSGNCIILTNNSFQNGAIWACTAINLNESFKMSCQANFGSFSSGGDGIAFLLQTEGVPQVIGAQAGAIGYAQGNGIGCQGGTCPITPSIAVEFDTWDNTVDGLNDIACDHSSMQTNGVMTAGNTLVGPACLKPGGVDVTDGVNHDICVIWDVALLRYRVYFDGVLILTYNGDIRTNFVNPASVYWGFTSGSGGAAQVQSVCSVSMLTNVSSPSCICTPPIASYSPSPVNICSGGLTGITLNSSQPSTTYSWLAVNNLSVNGESTTAQTGSTINETLINTTNVNQTVTYTVTPTTTCAGASISVPVTIYPAPSITNSPTSSSICSGSTATITPTSSLAGSTYNWTAVGSSPSVSGFTATGSGNISHLLVNTGPSVQTVTYTIAPTGPSPGFCIGAPTNFVVTVIPRPDIIPLANQTACSSYTLPTITGTNLTGTQAYWTGANGTGTSYPAGTAITTPGVNTLYIYNQTGTTPNCFDQETFTVTINSSPDITPLANQTACNSYTLPAITGTNLTGTQAYWTGANGTGTSYPAGTAITTPGVNTLYIYNQTGTTPNCFDQETFTVTINSSPDITPLANQTACNSYTLPAITGTNLTGTQAYWTGANGTGTSYPAGTAITTPGVNTLYIYNQTGTTPNCFDQETFTVTINSTPNITPLANQTACNSYTLPAITGTNLTGSQAYWTGANGTGTSYSAGTAITTPGVNTLYIYNQTGTTPNCFDQETFTVTINSTPNITPLANQTACNSYTLPAITGTNLTGTQAYWTGANGTGTSYPAGTVITTPGVNTLYTYNQTGTTPNCFDQETFTVTINSTPNITPLANQTACNSYTLPAITGTNLTGTQAYWTGVNGTGTSYSAGATITTPGVNTLYIYNQTGTTPNCFDQETFTVTINSTPNITPLANQTACNSYTLPAITGTNLTGTQAYWTGVNGTGTSYPAGTAITTPGVNTLYIYNQTGTTPNCFDQETFTVTINSTPNITPLANQTACNSYTLPAITGTNLTGTQAYWTGANGTGTSYPAGTAITTPGVNTLYIYNQTGTTPNCFDQETFTVTINSTPNITPLANQTACNSYTLPAITGTNLTGTQAYWTGVNGTGTSYSAGATITTPGVNTLYIYNQTGTTPNCFDEETFTITILTPPTYTLTPTNPPVCSGSDGSILISGLNATTNYDVTYSDGTTVTGPTTSGSNGSGNITIGGLTAGNYSVTLTLTGQSCTSSTVLTTLVNPGAPDLNPIANYAACDVSYTLPAISGSSMSGGQAYYDLPGGPAGGGNVIPVGTTYSAPTGITLYAYDESGGCTDQETFTVTINSTPNITPLANQTGCNSYSLPAITGTNLTGTQAYWTGANGTGTSYSAGTAITTPGVNTLYIYNQTGTTPNCFDEETFTVTINLTPDITPLANQTACNSYTLPAITGTNLTGTQAYWTGANGTGTSYPAGTAITTPGVNTLYIYNQTGTTPNCFDQETFTVTINSTPNITPLANQTACNSYTLPAITGTNLTGSQAYWTGANGTGTSYSAGTAITTPGVNTLYIYNQTGTTPNCFDQETFTVTINLTPDITPLANQTACNSYTLPAITGTNLTGTQAYWTGANGTGTSYPAGTVITTPGVNTLYTYNQTGTTPNCFDQETFTVTINSTPNITPLANQTACNSYTLPAITGTNLTGTQAYWTGVNGTGTSYSAGATITTPGVNTLYIYNQTGTTPNCFDQETFTVTINSTPNITPLANQTACNSYTLPAITGTNLTGTQAYWTGVNGTGTSYPAGTAITTPGVNTLYIYNQTGTTPNCFDQETFTVTINSTPNITPLANQTACNSYTLPAITGTNLTGTQAYWTGANGTGTSYPAGTAITTPGVNTLYIYNQTGTTPNCFDQETFTLTIENPVVFSLVPTDPTVCNGTDGLILISGLNAGTNYDVTYSDGTTTTGPTTTGSNGAGEITLGSLSAGSYTVTLSITGESCPGVSLSATLNNSVAPVLDPITNYSACDMGYALPTISGSSLSGNQAYYDLPGGPSGGGNVILAGTTYSAPTSITLYVYDENGVCSDQEMFSINIYNSPDITPLTDQTVCNSFTFPAITGSNLTGSELYWTGANGTGTSYAAGTTISTPGVSTLYIYNQTGTSPNCFDEKTFTVTISLFDDPSFSLTDHCNGDPNSATITGAQGGTFTFNPAPTDGALLNSTTGEITSATDGGVYSIGYTTSGACPSTELQVVTVHGTPTAPIVSQDETFCETGNLVNMSATGGSGTFNWYSDFGLNSILGTGPSLAPSNTLGTTIYYVTESSNGCEGQSSSVTITIEECEIIVPTAFTPNGDLANDTWEILFLDEFYPNNQVFVYNRWGNLIYESVKGDYLSSPWNGQYNGVLLPVASYYYIIELNDQGGDKRSGSVSIILD